VLDLELEEARVLELMSTGVPIRAHMALLNASAADRLVDVFVERYRLEREDFARPFPGMLELLGRLRSAGVGVGVVTSKLRQDALIELRATGLDEYIEVVVAFEDTDDHKPAPTPQREALRCMGTKTGVSVGDLPSDITSARAAGLAAIGVSWGYGARDALIDAGAECVCESAEELEREMVTRLSY
jgi:pyrophosphatase PpaX